MEKKKHFHLRIIRILTRQLLLVIALLFSFGILPSRAAYYYGIKTAPIGSNDLVFIGATTSSITYPSNTAPVRVNNSSWKTATQTGSATSAYLLVRVTPTGNFGASKKTAVHDSWFLGAAIGEENAKAGKFITDNRQGEWTGEATYSGTTYKYYDQTHYFVPLSADDFGTTAASRGYVVLVSTLVKVRAIDGEGNVVTNRGTVTITNIDTPDYSSVGAVGYGQKFKITAEAASGYKFQGWKVTEYEYNDKYYADDEAARSSSDNTTYVEPYEGHPTTSPDRITAKEYTFNAGATKKTRYEAVFVEDTGGAEYYHAKVETYPENTTLGDVAFTYDDSTPPDYTASKSTSADNESNKINVFAKANDSWFMGWAMSDEGAVSGSYASTDNPYTVNLITSSSKIDDPTDEQTKVYGVFSLVKGTPVDAGGREITSDVTIDITKKDTNIHNVISSGECATLTAGSTGDYTFDHWRVKGTTAVLSRNATYTTETITEKIEYEAVFSSPLVLVISSAAQAEDGKYYATIGNVSGDKILAFPDELTVYTVRYGEDKDVSDYVINKKNSSSANIQIPNIYATEEARTVTLSTLSGQQMELDELKDMRVGSQSYVMESSSSYNHTFTFGTSYNRLGCSNVASIAISDGYAANENNRQGVLVCSDSPGTYDLSYTTNTGIFYMWPRQNRMSARAEAFTPTDLSSYDYYVLSKKKGHVAFYPVAEGREIPAGKGFLRVEKGASGTKEYIDFLSDGTATGIENVAIATEDGNAPVYNLSGQRVGNGYKGIVIVNGKKYVRK